MLKPTNCISAKMVRQHSVRRIRYWGIGDAGRSNPKFTPIPVADAGCIPPQTIGLLRIWPHSGGQPKSNAELFDLRTHNRVIVLLLKFDSVAGDRQALDQQARNAVRLERQRIVGGDQ